MIKAALIILTLLIVVGLAFRLIGPWDRLLPAAPLTVTDFATLDRQPPANSYLLCPSGLCADADAESPVFEMSAPELLVAILRVAERSGTVTARMPREDGVELIVRTPLVRFPDRVSIQVFPVTEGTATLAIYSRSRYGSSDYGANRTRVEAWLSQL